MSFEGKRVLLTGVTGFIGSHLAVFLKERGADVHCVLRPGTRALPQFSSHFADLRRQDEIEAVFAAARPDFLVHLASRAQPGRDIAGIHQYYEDTVVPALNLALAAPASLRLAAFVGSCEEYGDGTPPFRERQRPEAFSPYGWAKISAYYGVELIARQRRISWTWLRPFLTFGPGQRSRALVPSLIEKLSRGENIPLTPGDQTRDLVYIADLCEMFARVLRAPEKAEGKVFNLCSGSPVRVADVARLVERLVGRGKVEIGALPYREREAMHFYGSNEAFTQVFGAVPLTPLERALTLTIGGR